MNRPLQVYLDQEDYRRLEKWTRQRGWTKSRAIRVAVRALTHEPTGDPLLDLSGDIDGLPPDLGEKFERYLNETFSAEAPRPSRARGPKKAVRR